MANGKTKKWSTKVDKAKPLYGTPTGSSIPGFPSTGLGTFYSLGGTYPGSLAPEMGGIGGQGSGYSQHDWPMASKAADIGAEEEFATTDEDIQKLGVLGGKPKKWPTSIDQANTNKMPGVLGGLTDAQKMAAAGDTYYTGLPGQGGGLGTGNLSDAQKMALAGDPYYSGQLGAGGGIGTGTLTDAQQMAAAGDPYYGIKTGVSGPASVSQPGGQPGGQSAKDAVVNKELNSGVLPTNVPDVPEEDKVGDGNDQYFKDAYANIYAQLESGNPYITLPDILDADGNIVQYYRDQETISQEFVGYEEDGTTPRYENVTRTVKIVDPRYARLEMIYTNAQTQANWMAQQKQTALSGERDWMRDIIPFLTEPGVADILGLLGGGGVDPLFQPMFGQGFGLPAAVQGADMPFGDEAAEAQLPAMAQPAMQQRQHLPTESYLQRIGPDAVKGLQGLMGFMGQTPYDLQRMVGSVTPQFSGIFPGGGGTPAQITGRV